MLVDKDNMQSKPWCSWKLWRGFVYGVHWDTTEWCAR